MNQFKIIFEGRKGYRDEVGTLLNVSGRGTALKVFWRKPEILSTVLQDLTFVAVDRLEAKGLVERRASAGDRRARIVHLTREGRKLITRAYADHAADMERLASELPAAERTTLIRLLKKIGYKATAASKQEA